MSIREIVLDLGVVVAVAGASFGSGYVRGTTHQLRTDNKSVLAVQTSEQATNATLTQLRQQLTDQAAKLKAAQQSAQQALLTLDSVEAQDAIAASQRLKQDKATLHEDHDCTALAAQPVCPALSQRLFGLSVEADAAPGTHTDH